jgi:hypothetical protein
MRPHRMRPALVVLVLAFVLSGCTAGKGGSWPTRRALSSLGDFGSVSFVRKHAGPGVADGVEILRRMAGKA